MMPCARKHLARLRRAWACVLALAAVDVDELDEPQAASPPATAITATAIRKRRLRVN